MPIFLCTLTLFMASGIISFNSVKSHTHFMIHVRLELRTPDSSSDNIYSLLDHIFVITNYSVIQHFVLSSSAVQYGHNLTDENMIVVGGSM